MSDTTKNTESKVTAREVKKYFSDIVKDIFDLDKGVDKWATIREIKSKQSMSGANAWMLICSIMIASIGLDLNSQAVIIGAMLISPLMSPILGIGLGVGINDKNALYHALMHFGAATIIALLTSYLYFWLSPLDEFTPQIQARTEPTVLDILIAIFGGIAGIVSIARKDISTTLPGVAIATALMPPLCVAGYGLANGEWGIASTAFYLFFLNSFFVAFATYVIIRRMNFPYKEYANPAERKKNVLIVSVFSIMMIIPSILIFVEVYKGYDRTRSLDEFIVAHFDESEIDYLDDYKLLPVENPNKLLLKVYGNVINESKIDYYKRGLKAVGLAEINDVEIISTNEIDLERFDKMNTKLSGLDDKLNAQIGQLKEDRESKQLYIEHLKSQNDFFKQDSAKFKSVCDELKIFFPELEELGLAVSQFSNFENHEKELPIVIARWPQPNSTDIRKLEAFIKTNYGLDTLRIIIE